MFDKSIYEVGDSNFETEVEQEMAIPVVVFFYSQGCVPCGNFAPVYNKIASTHSKHFKFLRIDGNVHKKTSEEIVSGYPTIAIFNRGKLFSTFTGGGDIVYFSQYINRALKRIQYKNNQEDSK